jgi:type II secretion system protein G
MKKKSKGFTLIELLVVIAIIGILATIVLVSLNTARQKARDSRRVSDLRQIALALEMYYDDAITYPGDSDNATCDDWNAMVTALQGGANPYMATVPVDPTQTQALCNVASPPAGCYMYNAWGTPIADYVLRATLEGTCGGTGVCGTDVDGTVSGCACDDASKYYCIQP